MVILEDNTTVYVKARHSHIIHWCGI